MAVHDLLPATTSARTARLKAAALASIFRAAWHTSGQHAVLCEQRQSHPAPLGRNYCPPKAGQPATGCRQPAQPRCVSPQPEMSAPIRQLKMHKRLGRASSLCKPRCAVQGCSHHACIIRLPLASSLMLLVLTFLHAGQPHTAVIRICWAGPHSCHQDFVCRQGC